jgi:4,5-dihydroxyphthalate decarboxylase
MPEFLNIKLALQTLGHTKAIKDGTLKPRYYTLDFEEVPQIIQAFRRMVRGLEFDMTEMAITTFMCAKAHGKAFTAIPVFVMRDFHHKAVVYNVKSDIKGPKDLEGKKVGVNRGYTVTTGVWARGIMQHQYGLDLDKVTWVLSGDEHVAEYVPPSNVVPIEKGKTMEELLLSGELSAAIGLQSDHPDIKPLIPDAEEEGFKMLAETGIFPINHTFVIKNELVDGIPDISLEFLTLFEKAKRVYLKELAAGRIEPMTKMDKMMKRVMDMTGKDPLPYGIEPNRKALETIIQYAHEQKIIPRRYEVEELFSMISVGAESLLAVED